MHPIRRPNRFPTSLAVAAALALLIGACAGTADVTPAAPTATSPSPTPSPAAADSPEATAEATETPAATGDDAEAEEVRVRIASSVYDPRELTVSPGTTVVFLNADSFAHTVTEGTDGQATDDPIVDEEIAQNRTVRVTFDDPGTYDITCRFHPSMQMTITVEG